MLSHFASLSFTAHNIMNHQKKPKYKEDRNSHTIGNESFFFNHCIPLSTWEFRFDARHRIRCDCDQPIESEIDAQNVTEEDM